MDEGGAGACVTALVVGCRDSDRARVPEILVEVLDGGGDVVELREGDGEVRCVGPEVCFDVFPGEGVVFLRVWVGVKVVGVVREGD